MYCKVATIGMGSTAGITTPISAFRSALAQPLRGLLRAILFTWGFHCIHVKGTKAPAELAPVIVPNHISFIEPLALVSMNLPMSVGAKATMMFPGFSAVHRLLQSIPLEKYATPDSVDTVYSRQWVKHQITSTPPPQGGVAAAKKNSPRGRLITRRCWWRGRTGVFCLGVPVQPMVLG